MKRPRLFETIAITLTALTVAACIGSIASAGGEGQDKDLICHNGNDLVVADPAIYQAHLDHGDCAGTCTSCLGRCCWIDQDGKSQTAVIYENECEAILGLWQFNEDAPCPFGGD